MVMHYEIIFKKKSNLMNLLYFYLKKKYYFSQMKNEIVFCISRCTFKFYFNENNCWHFSHRNDSIPLFNKCFFFLIYITGSPCSTSPPSSPSCCHPHNNNYRGNVFFSRPHVMPQTPVRSQQWPVQRNEMPRR